MSFSEGHDGRHYWRIYLEDSLPGRRGYLFWHFIGRAGQSLDEHSAGICQAYWCIEVSLEVISLSVLTS